MTKPRLTTFLSYASEREKEVRDLHRFLEALGVESWFDKESLVGGDAWDAERSFAQRRANLFLAVVSSETLKRDGVIHREIREALAASKDRLPGRPYIVPILLDPVELPEALAGYHAIQVYESDGRAQLARALQKASSLYGVAVSGALEVAAATTRSGGAIPRQHHERDHTGERLLDYFTYADAGPYWEYVNAEILKQAFGGLFGYRRMMTDWPTELQPAYWDCSIREFHRSGDLVSVTVSESDYFPNRPYPNHGLTTINIFGERVGRVGIRELFDSEPAAFDALKAYCDLTLKQTEQHMGGENITLDHYAEVYSWSLFEHFNVNDRGLILNFSSASGLPHVLGMFEVYVPWEFVWSHIPSSVRAFLAQCGMAPPAELDTGDPGPSDASPN